MALGLVLDNCIATDGGINPHREIRQSDVCINGMFLNYAAYFMADEDRLKSIIDCIISHQMEDGGFNCRSNTTGAKHSSLHSTISLLEGIREYISNDYKYRVDDLRKIEKQAGEFILAHRLYKSDKTNAIINKGMTMLSFPSRWKFDILRGLDYFCNAKVKYDSRMQDAIDILINKRLKDGTWPVQARHPGKVHFEMETIGKRSRINTLRALRVLDYFQ